MLELSDIAGVVSFTAAFLSKSKYYSLIMSNQTHSEKIISQIVRAIRSSLDLKTIFSIAVEEIGKLLQLDHVTISEFVSEEKGWLTVADYRMHLDLPTSVGTYIIDKNNLVTAKLKQ